MAWDHRTSSVVSRHPFRQLSGVITIEVVSSIARCATPDDTERQALDAAKVAFDLGSDVNHTDHGGSTALHTAAQRNYTTVVRFLAENGADLNVEDGAGRTPLMLAKRAETGRLARPDITRYTSGNTAEVLRELGAIEETEEGSEADAR